MTKFRFLLLTSFALLLFSCRTQTEERVTKGEEYFPVRIGDIRYYQIDTVIYDVFDKSIDTISHRVKEEVVEKFTDFNNDTVYRIELSTYSDQKVEWVVFKSFERRIQNVYALEKMENNTEVKMLFPIAQYKTKGSAYTWNANMFNNREPVIVKYTSVFSAFHNGIMPFNDCVSIKMNKPRVGFVNLVKEEVYAKNVGLVYRYTDSTDNLIDSTFPSGKKTFIRLEN